MSMMSMCCVLWTTVAPPDAQRLSVIIPKSGKQFVTFETMTTLMYHVLELKRILDHVTSKELDPGIGILLQ